MKKTIGVLAMYVTASCLLSAGAAQAAPIYVDCSDFAVPAGGSVYNTIAPSASGPDCSFEGSGENFTNLRDADGNATGINLNVRIASSAGDVRGGDSDTPDTDILGINAAATTDGFWCNNGALQPANFGYTLTFSNVPAGTYDIVVAGSSQKVTASWSIAGDARTILVAGGTASWSNISPVGGAIVITSSSAATATYSVVDVNFVSLTLTGPPPGIYFTCNFDGTSVTNFGGTIGYGAQLAEANLNAGTTFGTWTVNKVQAAPTARSSKMIQTDGGANVANKALRFGIDFTGTVGVNTTVLTANLTSPLSLSDTITVSFAQGMISSDGYAARITYLTGLDGSNYRLFQIGFDANKQLGYVSSAGTWTLIGTAGDLAGNNNTYWIAANMKNVTVEIGASDYDIKLNGIAVTGGSGIAFRDAAANGLGKLAFSSNHRYTGSAFDNMVVRQVNTTPPTVVSIADNAGGSVEANATVTYTLTFSEIMVCGSISPTDFSNTAVSNASAITVGAITPATDTNVFEVVVTPTGAGELRLGVSSNVTDLVGNPMVADVDDDTTITITADPTPATAVFYADFNGTVASNYSGSLYGAQITEASLDAGTAVGSWTVNQAQSAPTGVEQKQIQPDRAQNVAEKCLAFGAWFDGTKAVDTAILTANLTEELSASDSQLVRVSLDYCILKTDAGNRRTILTGKDGGGNRLFQVGFVNSGADKRLGYVDRGGVWIPIGSAGDLNAQNQKVWNPTGATSSPTIMKHVTITIGGSSYAIALEGATQASGVAFRDASARGFATMELSATSTWTGGFIDNLVVEQDLPSGMILIVR